jgi:U3 small nucleolar RNA-associated protein 20
MFSELQKKGEDNLHVGHHTSYEVMQDDEAQIDEIWEDERSWRDPSAHKLRVALARWLDSAHRIKGLIKVRHMNRVPFFVIDVALGIPYGRTF